MPDAVIPASHRDLLEKCPIVTLATSGPDGFPQVSAMWFLIEPDGTIAASLNTSRQKTRNLSRHPEVTLFFIDPGNPYRTLELRCRASVEPDPDYAFADRVSAKYGAGSLREQDRPGESRRIVRFAPVKANTFG